MDAERTETTRALFEADPKESGDIYVNGKKVLIRSPQDAASAGNGRLSEDRNRYGVVLKKNITKNFKQACLQR